MVTEESRKEMYLTVQYRPWTLKDDDDLVLVRHPTTLDTEGLDTGDRGGEVTRD